MFTELVDQGLLKCLRILTDEENTGRSKFQKITPLWACLMIIHGLTFMFLAFKIEDHSLVSQHTQWMWVSSNMSVITTTKSVIAPRNNLWKWAPLPKKWFPPFGLFGEIYIKEMDAGVKKYQGQVFASLQSFDSNIKSLFPHRMSIFFILFILKWAKFLADIYVWTSDGASIIHMLFLKSGEENI